MTRRADLSREQKLHAVMARHGGALFRETVLAEAELSDLGHPAEIAGYGHPAFWVDGDLASVVVGESARDERCACGDPECEGWTVSYDLLGVVTLHEGRWWWSAMGLGHTSDVPEETQADARRAMERRYAKAAG